MHIARRAIQALVCGFQWHQVSAAGEPELDLADPAKAMIQMIRAPVQGYPRMPAAADEESEQDHDVMLAAANRSDGMAWVHIFKSGVQNIYTTSPSAHLASRQAVR